MATIRKKGEYQWHVQIRRRGHPTQTKTFNTKSDAEAWARMIESEMDRGVFLSRSEAERVTVAEIIDRYLVEVTPSKRNIREETRLLGKIKEEFGVYFLSAIQAKHVAAWRDRMVNAGRAGSTINHHVNTLSTVIDTAIKEWGYVLAANPCSLIKRAKAGKSRDRRLVGEEESRLLDACGKSTNPWIVPAVKIALETAARQSELLSLVWSDVDLARCVARVRGIDGRDTKNEDPYRDVPLSPRAVSVLRGLPRSIDDRVFPTAIGAFRACFDRSVKRAGIKDLRFHDLRHEATSRLFEKGLNPMEAAAVTGHKTLQMLKRYTHLRAEDLARKLG